MMCLDYTVCLTENERPECASEQAEMCGSMCNDFIPCVTTTQRDDIDCQSGEVQRCEEECLSCAVCTFDDFNSAFLPHCHNEECERCQACERFVEPCVMEVLECEWDDHCR